MINEMEMYQIMVPTHKPVDFIFSSVKNLELTLLFYERKCDCVCAMNYIVTQSLLRLFPNNILNNFSCSEQA